MLWQLTAIFLVAWCTAALALPSMRGSLTNPVHVHEGDDALITCVVKDLGDNNVMWKKEDRERHSTRVLTAGENRVTGDARFSVLHDPVPLSAESKTDVNVGGDVWVLLIKDTKATDSGVYVCEVNSNPIVRSFHKLSVVSRALTPPENTTDFENFSKGTISPNTSRNHNYTDCCVSRNVSTSCLGFCNIQSILEGSTGTDPESCEADFPGIIKCMADGRNHVPCCIQERVPDICQDVCRGEYTSITDNIKTHFSCAAYTEQTLACIVEGIELLPSPPQVVIVEPLTENKLRVSWSFPESNSESLTGYSINVTSLRSFDDHLIDPNENAGNETKIAPHTVHVQIPDAKQNQTDLDNLSPFTMYEVTVTSMNGHGSSLPSTRVRSLTLTPQKMKVGPIGEMPKMPDIKSCCASKQIGHTSCIDKLCDPVEAATVEITDLMICAPWASDTFNCLANGMDHTPCCKAKGLPDICQQLCTGNVSYINFNYFRYMGQYTNCLLQGYGVLPSAPTYVHVTNINTDFVILHWEQPKTLANTVLHYNVHYRMLTTYDTDYKTIDKVNPPYVLEGLLDDTDYEFYVEPVNAYGVGDESIRLNFKTSSEIVEEKIEEASNYNVTHCCAQAELSNVCMPLCSYNAKMSDVKQLAGVCAAEFHKLIRCGAGGRNHAPCCSRRGVPNACLSLCNGVMVDSLMVTVTTCIPYIGNIAQCFEEGTDLLPAPVEDLHATVANNGKSILIEWDPPSESNNVTDYELHCQKVENSSSLYDAQNDQVFNTSETKYLVDNIDPDGVYRILTVARNEHGKSLPSAILMINVTEEEKVVKGVTSPPHTLAVSSHSATYVTISWQPPIYSQPSEALNYMLHYKSTFDSSFKVVNTSVTSHNIDGLTPNTQYIVFVKAVSKQGSSLPSETLIAWTDPAYPAFVEPPTVHPINLVIEGSSMTILCIAMGTPMPTISLYISGRLVRQEITRHMVTVIHKVTKDMDQISCYADNGYGTPMQASRKINISYGPHIQPGGITMAAPGESVILECKVDARPEPKMMFWKSHEDRTPVIQGGKYDISTQRMHTVNQEDNKYIMRLTIQSIDALDAGDYFCHAENAFGSETRPVSVRIRSSSNGGTGGDKIMQCCKEQNVTSGCLDACSFYLDIDAVADKLECLHDFDKLMKCAADGSDHRNCCIRWGVPRRCLDWCRGEALDEDDENADKACLLSHTKTIINCFHDGREKLPGPPRNVRLVASDHNSVKVAWDAPVKNPHTVEIYRVVWKVANSEMKTSMKGDTSDTFMLLTNLKDGVSYEVTVKAGNSRGTSIVSEPIRFTVGSKYIKTAASRSSDEEENSGNAVAIVLAVLLVSAVLVVGVIWLLRNRKFNKNSDGVAFENPSYLREVNMDHIQVSSSSQNESTSNGGVQLAVSATSGGAGWKQESLHVPAGAAQQQEVNPTLYEELKLGPDGAGFKRLKP